MSKYQQLINDGQNYLKNRYDLLRIELLDKLSVILGMIVLVIVALFLLLAAIAYFSVALVGLLAKCLPMSVACCLLGAVFVIVLIVLYLLREKVFINPFVKLLSGVIFSDYKSEDAMSQELMQTQTEEKENDANEANV